VIHGLRMRPAHEVPVWEDGSEARGVCREGDEKTTRSLAYRQCPRTIGTEVETLQDELTPLTPAKYIWKRRWSVFSGY
jgi:hypothetical protein